MWVSNQGGATERLPHYYFYVFLFNNMSMGFRRNFALAFVASCEKALTTKFRCPYKNTSLPTTTTNYFGTITPDLADYTEEPAEKKLDSTVLLVPLSLLRLSCI